MPDASVVIPAHDEAAVIGRLLQSLADGFQPGELDVVVVCNGCTDGTADVARRFPGVRVVEIPEASKVAALNAGDAATSTFPRVYVDADVVVPAHSLRAVVDALRAGAPAAAPLPVVDTRGCGLLVRAYYAVFTRLGYTNRHVVGSGVYGLSAEGRARFGAFPELVADDGFVYGLFAQAERVNPSGATFTVRAPRTLTSLLRRRVRIAAGIRQLDDVGHRAPAPGPTWSGVVAARPWLAPAAGVYLGVNALGDAGARRRLRSGEVSWNRDDTSRDSAARNDGAAAAPTRSSALWRRRLRFANFLRYDGDQVVRASIGPGARVSPSVSVRNGARVSIGAGAHVGQGCFLWAGDATGRIEVGDHALLAPGVFVTASNYDFDAGDGPVMDLPKREADVTIGANTWLGAGVVVLPGVSIGDGTVVAAHAVVTRDLPPGVLAAGVPAVVLRKRGESPA